MCVLYGIVLCTNDLNYIGKLREDCNIRFSINEGFLPELLFATPLFDILSFKWVKTSRSR